VALLAIKIGWYDFNLLAAAILHDVPEDTTKTASERSKLYKEMHREVRGENFTYIVRLLTLPLDTDDEIRFKTLLTVSIKMFFEGQSGPLIKSFVKRPISMQKRSKSFDKLINDKDLFLRCSAIILKVLDRIHGMMTLATLPEEDQLYKIEETQKFFPMLLQVLKETLHGLNACNRIKDKKILDVPHKLEKLLSTEIAKRLAEMKKKGLLTT
jgi:hypothetical protein